MARDTVIRRFLHTDFGRLPCAAGPLARDGRTYAPRSARTRPHSRTSSRTDVRATGAPHPPTGSYRDVHKGVPATRGGTPELARIRLVYSSHAKRTRIVHSPRHTHAAPSPDHPPNALRPLAGRPPTAHRPPRRPTAPTGPSPTRSRPPAAVARARGQLQGTPSDNTQCTASRPRRRPAYGHESRHPVQRPLTVGMRRTTLSPQCVPRRVCRADPAQPGRHPATLARVAGALPSVRARRRGGRRCVSGVCAHVQGATRAE
jgi:hypothetical protein